MVEKFKQQKQITISELDTLKVISDPLRLQIIEAMMGQPRTVKQVAAQVNLAPGKLYYHINLLEKHGLIVVVDTQIVSGIVEKWYSTVAQSISIDRRLLKVSPAGKSDLITTVLEATASEIHKGIADGTIDLSEDAVKERKLLASRTRALLTPEQARQFQTRLQELLAEFDDIGERNDSIPGENQGYALLVTLYPFDAGQYANSSQEEQEDEQ